MTDDRAEDDSPWVRYRRYVEEEHADYLSQLTTEPPIDSAVSQAIDALVLRLNALTPRLPTARSDDNLAGDFEQLLTEHRALRDSCVPGSRGWEIAESQSCKVMVFLALIATVQGRPRDAREWFTWAAEGFRGLGDQGRLYDCRLGIARASLASGVDADLVLETVESSLGDFAPVRKASALATAVRILVDMGDHAEAQRRADEAAAALTALGYVDPVAAGSGLQAFGSWLQSGHRETMAGLPWLQFPFQLVLVAETWVALINARSPLGGMSAGTTQPIVDELSGIKQHLIAVTEEIGSPRSAPHDGGPDEVQPTARYPHYDEQLRKLIALDQRAELAVPGSAEEGQLLADLAAVELAAVHGRQLAIATSAAVRRADVLLRANRMTDAAAVTETAQGRLGDGDGLNVVRRRMLLVELLHRRAAIAERRHQFDLLSQLCGAAIIDFEAERDGVNEPYLQDSYLRRRARLYELGVEAAAKLGDHELALLRADLTKARGSLAWGTVSRPTTGADIAAGADLDALQAEWSELAQNPASPDTTARRRAVYRRLMTAQSRAVRGARPQPRFAALQATLAPDEALLYQYMPDRETLLLYVITPAAVAVEQHPLGQIRASLDVLADDISSLEGEMGWLESDIPPLGEHLLPQENAQVLNRTRRVLISPHRTLHQIPLHALDWRGAPLIERFAVSYLPNAASLLLPRPMAFPPAVLSIGIDSFPPPLPELPGAEQEADDIAAMYRQVGTDATVLLGPDASRSRLEHLRTGGGLERFSVIHLATHGNNVPPEEPSDASLYLSDAPVDAMDISQWALHAGLVSMSACWSGRRPTRGRRVRVSPGGAPPGQDEELFADEIYGLQAAFFASGARQVLGSLWPLDNGSGPAVMRSFHAGISRSIPADIALQTAVNQQRTAAGKSFYHWAPYKLIVLGRPVAEVRGEG